MKLKSKLIATIVSICAAIAVMGVGVWAATDTFNVKVQNSVNVAFASLDGTVWVTASAAQTGATGVTAAPSLTRQEIYIPNTKAINNILATKTNVEATNELEYAGVNFFDTNGAADYIDGDTTNAESHYLFEYTPATTIKAGVAVVEYQITEAVAPEAMLGSTNAFTVKYFISVDGANWVEMVINGDSSTSGKFYADAATEVHILAICEYTNTAQASIKSTEGKTNWTFKVNMFAAAGDTTTGYTAATSAHSTITFATGDVTYNETAGTNAGIFTKNA